MIVACEWCTAAADSVAARSVIESLSAEQRQAIANRLGLPACPRTLCAKCTLQVVSWANESITFQSQKPD
jgi:hypothetical protein